jgi:cell division protein FtsZ
MPERRARMLSVEEAPVVSVPVVAPDNWLQETAPEPARFLSQDEEPEEEAADSEDQAFFSSSEPGGAGVADRSVEPEPELVAAQSRPQFGEMSEEAAYTPLPRDYSADFGNTVRVSAEAEEQDAAPATTLFSPAGEDAQPDLDVPAFMRRVKF